MLVIEYSQLPKSIIAIYTKICDTQYAIINELINDINKPVVEIACQYLFENNANNHILQYDNLTEMDIKAFEYATNYLKGYNVMGDVV